MAFGIKRSEAKTRMGYILLGFFTLYLVNPLRDWIDTNFHVNPIVLGVIGIIATLYFFEF